MVVGTLQAFWEGHRALPPVVEEAMQYLQDHDFTQMAEGKYPIKGEDFYASLSRYTTRDVSECFPERHQEFVDVQYLVEGEEYLGWCPLSPDLVVREPYDAARDIMFYEGLVPESSLVLAPGSYAVLFPHDVHRPQVATEDGPAPVTKVVVKIAVKLL